MRINSHGFKANEKGHLVIGGVDATELARIYETPLYVYDIEKVRYNCRLFFEAFQSYEGTFQVSYASKAFSSLAIFQVIAEEGLSLDVVSQGELYTALESGFPPEKIHFHGNNKSKEELQMAIDTKIGCIVLDNMYEIDLLNELLDASQSTMSVLMRVTPGIESETHAYIMTGNEDSKFGFNLANNQANLAFKKLHQHPRIQLKGLHSHIGSQIFNSESFVKAVEVLFKQIEAWHADTGFEPSVMNFGGGYGIRYTKDDKPIENNVYVEQIIKQVKHEVSRLNLPLPEIWIEPGRSIVGDAGISLYTIGSMKEIPNVRKYVTVDGGMSDNIRPALYDAKYEAVLANKATMEAEEVVSIAGKCCESGDMLIWDLDLPKAQQGDILAMFSTGAYGYAMASNYNRMKKPAVVFVENGKHQLVVKRETLKDMLRNDKPYINTKKV